MSEWQWISPRRNGGLVIFRMYYVSCKVILIVFILLLIKQISRMKLKFIAITTTDDADALLRKSGLFKRIFWQITIESTPTMLIKAVNVGRKTVHLAIIDPITFWWSPNDKFGRKIRNELAFIRTVLMSTVRLLPISLPPYRLTKEIRSTWRHRSIRC